MDALLAFIGEHRFVLPAQAGALLGTDEEVARTRLRELTDTGHLIEQPVLVGQPVAYRSTRLGLDVIGSRLRSLPISLTNYWHDVGAAWLWLAARNGAFGPMREVLAERVIRSRDAKGRDDPFGVRLGGLGRDGRERLHYPDLLLVDGGGRRVAIELEITAQEPVRAGEDPRGLRRRSPDRQGRVHRLQAAGGASAVQVGVAAGDLVPGGDSRSTTA